MLLHNPLSRYDKHKVLNFKRRSACQHLLLLIGKTERTNTSGSRENDCVLHMSDALLHKTMGCRSPTMDHLHYTMPRCTLTMKRCYMQRDKRTVQCGIVSKQRGDASVRSSIVYEQ